LNAEGLFLNFE